MGLFRRKVEEEAPAVASGMAGMMTTPSDAEVEIVQLAPRRNFEAPAAVIGSRVEPESYARFNEPEQVPWPGVYSLAEDGVSPEYFCEFDADNAVYVYARLKNAR
jgi:hypothetical protein